MRGQSSVLSWAFLPSSSVYGKKVFSALIVKPPEANLWLMAYAIKLNWLWSTWRGCVVSVYSPEAAVCQKMIMFNFPILQTMSLCSLCFKLHSFIIFFIFIKYLYFHSKPVFRWRWPTCYSLCFVHYTLWGIALYFYHVWTLKYARNKQTLNIRLHVWALPAAGENKAVFTMCSLAAY